MRRIRIGLRLALGFGVLAVILLLQGMSGLGSMASMNSQTKEISNIWIPTLNTIGDLNAALLVYRISAIRLVVDPSAAGVAKGEANLQAREQDLEQATIAFERQITEPEERPIFAEFVQAKLLYRKSASQVLAAMKAGDAAAAIAIVDVELKSIADQMSEMLNKLEKINRDGAEQAAVDSADAYGSAQTLVIGSIVIALLATATLAVAVTRSIVTPIREAVTATETIAGGNLTQKIYFEGKDEPAQLLASLALMQDNLRTTITHIGNSSVQLASAGEELSSVAEGSSRNLQRQNDEIQQAASAVTEMSAAVDEVARNAVSTAEASNESSRLSHEGRDKVAHTVSA